MGDEAAKVGAAAGVLVDPLVDFIASRMAKQLAGRSCRCFSGFLWVRPRPRVMVAILILVLMQSSYARPSDQYEACFNPCIFIPKSRAIERPLPDVPTFFSASAFQECIETARNQGMKGDVLPLPDKIREKLVRFFDASLLASVRYKVCDPEILETARLAFNAHEFEAITLVDLIVFRSVRDAETNIPLWAHELFHVQQFRNLGVKNFAINYAQNFVAVEEAAKEKERQVADSIRAEGMPGCSDATLVATAIYQRVLEREPDAQSLEHNASLLYNNKMTVRNLMLEMLLSEEHASRFSIAHSAAEQVTYLYRHALAREPDSVEETHSTRRLAEIGYHDLVRGIVASAEYSTRFSDWVVPGGALQVVKYCP